MKGKLEVPLTREEKKQNNVDRVIAKTPTVVRDEVARLHARIKELCEQLDAEQTSPTNTRIVEYGGSEYKYTNLPDNCRIRFFQPPVPNQLKNDHHSIDVELKDGTLQVRTNNGCLVVLPGASNSVVLLSRPHGDF